jgi:hypothetical protein
MIPMHTLAHVTGQRKSPLSFAPLHEVSAPLFLVRSAKILRNDRKRSVGRKYGVEEFIVSHDSLDKICDLL